MINIRCLHWISYFYWHYLLVLAPTRLDILLMIVPISKGNILDFTWMGRESFVRLCPTHVEF